MLLHPDNTSFPPSSERSIVVLTCVDGALRDGTSGSCSRAREALDPLTSRGVPVVLTSYHRPDELIAIQAEIGLRHPLIAQSGRSLYIPRGYFVRVPNIGEPVDGWERLDFTPPSLHEAIEMLIWLYRVSGDSPLLVGIGVSPLDRGLLQYVDVPVVVCTERGDQRALRAEFPHAYVTSSVGPQGWREAMLGVGVADGGVASDQNRG